jgi:transcriptional regulator with XRE-family HTH domain
MDDRQSWALALKIAAMSSESVNSSGFPQRLRELRRQKNLSQTELGEKAGVHYTHISKYERGVSTPSVETIRGLAEALGVSTDFLMDGDTQDAARARFQDRELLRQFQEVEKLPEEDKDLVKRFLDAFLFKRQVENMTAKEKKAG